MKKVLFTACLLLAFTIIAQAQSAEDFARRAFSKMEMEDFKGAIDDFSSAIRLQPDYEILYKAYFGRGISYFQNRKYRDAKRYFDRSIRIYQNDPEVYFWRAYAKYHIRRYSAASEIADYNRAIILKPDYAEAYFNRGQARIKNKSHRAGCSDLRKAYELGFEEAEIHIRIHCGEL